MARFWPRILQTVLAILAVWLLAQLLMQFEVSRLLPEALNDPPPAAVRLRHPAFWLAGLIAGSFHLWSSAALLALYLRLEKLVQSSEIK